MARISRNYYKSHVERKREHVVVKNTGLEAEETICSTVTLCTEANW